MARGRGQGQGRGGTRGRGRGHEDKASASSDTNASSARRSASPAKSAASTRRSAATEAELLPKGKLYYRIGEVAKLTGVKPHVLRYWETEFRWMSPPKSRSKQRLYRRKDIEMITVIKRLLYEERYTIAGARQRLKELGLAKARESAAEDAESATPSRRGGARTNRRSGASTSASASTEADAHPFARLRDELEQIRAQRIHPMALVFPTRRSEPPSTSCPT